MQAIFKFNTWLNGIVWGPWMLCFLVGTGVYLTLLLGFPQIRYFKIFWKEVFGKKAEVAKGDKSISSFAAMATAMAATVGTGNVAGVATALHLGGPGALVWMLFSAFFGMCTKFSEVALAVHFRQKDEHGDWRGGTMYILEHGARQKWLAIVFAIFTFLASFGIGAAVQSNATAEGLSMAFNIDPLYSGIALSVLVGLVIIGGLKSLSTVTMYLVPFLAVFYVIGALVVLAMNVTAIPGAIAAAIKYAFSDPMAMPGGLAGWAVKEAITKGIARGVFSNEAGLGSAPMVHATANVDHPARQGLYGLFEVFVDTFVICSMTALVILATQSLTAPVAIPGQELGELAKTWTKDMSGAKLTLYAFEMGIGSIGKYILSVGLTLFAFTTILGWYWYAETATTYLMGVWFKPFMKIIYIVLVFLGAAGAQILGANSAQFLNNLWDMADTLNGLMAIPNLIGLILLSGVLRKLVIEFDAKRKNGEIKL
jgi:AGCS family alanine or glycine:cation symporter